MQHARLGLSLYFSFLRSLCDGAVAGGTGRIAKWLIVHRIGSELWLLNEGDNGSSANESLPAAVCVASVAA